MSTETSVGWCERQVEEELPQLRIVLAQAQLPAHASPTGSAPHGVRQRLAALSNRFNGAKAVNMRREPVTAAYRVFFRHIGLDPDVVRTPIEAAVLDRMFDGGFLSKCLLADVLLIAMLDTGVPVWALDAQSIDGEVGVRTSRAGEILGRAGDSQEVAQGEAQAVGAGQLVVADARGALALLFADPAQPYRPSGRSRRIVLYALQVAGVPWLAVEEALWICRSALEAL
jgi:DNA/RNA-binding domain of Phe-tRNA-synthetase-like protein